MDEFDLNLSTRPFPAYQFKALLLISALVVLIALSAWQGYGFMRYSSLAAGIRGDAREAAVESGVLDRRLVDIDAKLTRPEAVEKLSEIAFLNNIIARKSFSWARIFVHLENVMPDAVHLLSLRPEFPPEGGVLLYIQVRGRSMPDIKQLIDNVQSSPVFDPVIVSTEEKREGTTNAAPAVSSDIEVVLRVPYHPEREPQ
jgi:hypothetical protein